MIEVSWTAFKDFVASRGLSIQNVEVEGTYYLYAVDGPFYIQTRLHKDGGVDVTDFEANFKANGNRKISEPKDSDGSPLSRVKVTTSGWHYQLHGLEFTTSKIGSLYSKKIDGTDYGFATMKVYDESGTEITTQDQANTSAVKTVVDWEPNHDLEIIGGMVKQAVAPSEDIRLWVVGAPDIPYSMGGQRPFATNINMKFMGTEEGVKVDGRAPKFLPANSVYHSNKIRLIFTHPAGLQHAFLMVFELFKA
jgi:hypothetical protein